MKIALTPLTVFSWFFKEEVSLNGCSKTFKVFDGKKRFLVEVANSENPKTSLVNQSAHGSGDSLSARGGMVGSLQKSLLCKITMIGGSLEESKEAEGNHKNRESITFWPFNKKDQVIEVSLDLKSHSKPFIEKILIRSPIGDIVGRLLI